MTTEQLEALEAEIDAIDTAEGVWTEEALARRAVIAEILDKAGRW